MFSFSATTSLFFTQTVR
ncbi:hypothetical protein E2C01_084237 [Portunus trituberculatus]|uniref:Uncharacterized protein n=1 Tax=Portunus trituberculatus TaxID=210409 RepID=A0A5B7J8P8_PORTR|nr:hypothetical protein [Portunus trituberculatus]